VVESVAKYTDKRIFFGIEELLCEDSKCIVYRRRSPIWSWDKRTQYRVCTIIASFLHKYTEKHLCEKTGLGYSSREDYMVKSRILRIAEK
jgi:hypothetical protein